MPILGGQQDNLAFASATDPRCGRVWTGINSAIRRGVQRDRLGNPDRFSLFGP